jgi:threonine/homoserine/homoserine lactone efflux protein
MLVVVFIPQFSPATSLPGSKGSLMLLCGGVAAVILVLGLLASLGWLGLYFSVFVLNAIFFLIAVAGGVVMGWAGWQEFQAEGGKFQLGAASTGASTPPPPAAPPAAPPADDEPR